MSTVYQMAALRQDTHQPRKPELYLFKIFVYIRMIKFKGGENRMIGP